MRTNKQIVTLEILTRPAPPLPARLAAEWVDPRRPELAPYRSSAMWRCGNGHNFTMTREARERYDKGCPTCAAKNPAKAARPAKVKAAPTVCPAPAPAAAPAAPAPSTVKDSTSRAAPHQYGGDVVVTIGGKPVAEVGQITMDDAGAEVARRDAAYARHGVMLVRDLLGRPARAISWDTLTPPPVAAPPARRAHHLFVIDRSGSTYGDIDAMRGMVRKLLAVEEFKRPDLLVSVVSYSSYGDVRVHVTRTPVSSIGAAELRALDELRATGLTCVSGGLRVALDLASADETTTVTLHSDGWANDRSPSEERRECEARVAQLVALGATVHTIAYRSSSDFAFLAALANRGGGACVQATTVQDVYSAVETFQRAAVTPRAVGRRVSTQGADYILRVHPGLRRVLLWRAGPGAQSTLDVDDGDTVYRLRDASVGGADAGVLGFQLAAHDLPVALAFARGLVSVGRVTLAKEVAMSTGITSLRKHERALTGSQVAEFAAALDEAIAFGLAHPDHTRAGVTWTRVTVKPRPAPRLTLPELLAILARNPTGVKVDAEALTRSYTRRGVRRVPGKWAGTTLEKPAYDVVPRRAGTDGGAGWVDLVSIDQNDAEATVNMTLAQPVTLVRTDGRTAAGERVPAPSSVSIQVPVSEIAGVSLESLKTYRAYTVVSDGEVSVKSLRCRIVDHRLWSELAAVGAAVPPVFDPSTATTLDLDLPLTRDRSNEAPPTASSVLALLRLTTLQRILKASLPPALRSLYTPEQVAALGAASISPSLYFSPHTVYAYPDLKKAQMEGKVDSRVRYRVTFGTDGVLSTDDLHGANEYLRRRFVVMDGRTPGAPHLEKPTMVDFFDPQNTVRPKTPEELRKLTIGPVDALEMPLYEAAMHKVRAPMRLTLGYAERILTDMDLPGDFGAGAVWSEQSARAGALALVERAIERLRIPMRESVFAVGASGCVPDSWGQALDAQGLARVAPAYKLAKEELDGQFYAVAGVVAAVYSRETLYSVD